MEAWIVATVGKVCLLEINIHIGILLRLLYYPRSTAGLGGLMKYMYSLVQFLISTTMPIKSDDNANSETLISTPVSTSSY